jgi:hypothetical protein
MWMDAYVHEVLVRQQIRDAQERAARQFALSNARRGRHGRRAPGRLTQLLKAIADLHPKQLIARVAER